MHQTTQADSGGVRPLRLLDGPGFRVRERIWDARSVVPTRPRTWATLCLAIEGGYLVEVGSLKLDCAAASLMLMLPGEVYRARISDWGSHCLTIDIDPAVLLECATDLPALDPLSLARRLPPHWLAFELQRELELGDNLSSVSVAGTVMALLEEIRACPGLEARSQPPPWLARVQEQIDDEFRHQHTLEGLARTAGVHHVHLAREFRRRLGCTVGHYIRQRRVEHACHRLMSSLTPLSEIAFDSGFADQSHFTNTFRDLVGIPPGAFRARFKR